MKTAINGATTMKSSLMQDVEAAAEVGFDGVELWWQKVEEYLLDHQPSELERLLVRNGLAAVSICPLLIWPFRDTEGARKSFARALEIASSIGCRMLIVCPDFRPARMAIGDAMAIEANELKVLADLAAREQVHLAVEPIGRHSLVPGPREALHLIDLAGSPQNVGIAMDTFHFFRSQVSSEEVSSIPVERLLLIHVNDVEDGPLDELTDANRVYPTLGVMPLIEMLAAVNRTGYQGYLSVETFRPSYWGAEAREVARNAMTYLRAAMDAAGIG